MCVVLCFIMQCVVKIFVVLYMCVHCGGVLSLCNVVCCFLLDIF